MEFLNVTAEKHFLCIIPWGSKPYDLPVGGIGQGEQKQEGKTWPQSPLDAQACPGLPGPGGRTPQAPPQLENPLDVRLLQRAANTTTGQDTGLSRGPGRCAERERAPSLAGVTQ